MKLIKHTKNIKIFRNFIITNIKIAKDELFDSFIYKFIFYYFLLLKDLIIFPNYKIWKIYFLNNNKFPKFYNFILKNEKNIL